MIFFGTVYSCGCLGILVLVSIPFFLAFLSGCFQKVQKQHGRLYVIIHFWHGRIGKRGCIGIFGLASFVWVFLCLFVSAQLLVEWSIVHCTWKDPG
ncbi:hypothetical protein BJY01DRAFT_156399 [Aspergillus pseudoustus]|uniref:Uncharacterized protein n=1 Tax=Aspergillus pseudoustus TaxID=1810923 RepID=A0ABR4K854_9EURO